jgi:hypothetical protein
MKLSELPEDVAQIYKLHDLVDANGFVSIKTKGMYSGLCRKKDMVQIRIPM